MIKHIFLLFSSVLLLSCSHKPADSAHKIVIGGNDSIHRTETEKPAVSNEADRHFKSIAEVMQDQHSIAWVRSTGKTSACSLHFNMGNKDVISMEYSPECWLMFPLKIKDDEMIVYWSCMIDTKYNNLSIIKAIKNTDQKYAGKPFMVLKLVNDSTLSVDYPNPEIKDQLNAADKNKVLFVSSYVAVNRPG